MEQKELEAKEAEKANEEPQKSKSSMSTFQWVMDDDKNLDSPLFSIWVALLLQQRRIEALAMASAILYGPNFKSSGQ